MLPAAIVRTLTSVSCSPSTASHCISSESGRQRKGTSRAGRENKRHRKHGTPSRRKGRVRSAASLGGPDPGATRRLCPGRIARALLGFIFEEVLEDLRPGEFRWNCDASTPTPPPAAARRHRKERRAQAPPPSTRDLIEEAVRRGYELDRSGELCDRPHPRMRTRPQPPQSARSRSETISRKRQRENTGSWIGAAHSCRAVPRPSAALASRSTPQRLRLAIFPFGLGAEFLARQNRRPPPSSAHRSGPLVPHGCWRGSPGFFQPLPEGPTA